MRDRKSLASAIRHAAAHPERARWYLRRLKRDAVLRVRHRGDHLGYYSAVVDDLVVQGKATAVGDLGTKRSRRIGRMQFEFLLAHGLKPEHRILEIGCGNLRAGQHLIRYLKRGHYYGVDISNEVLLAAQRTVAERGLAGKLPYLAPVRDMGLAFLPDEAFDVVHAHSVFSHTPLAVIEDCLAHVGRLMKPDGFFDFTFKRTEGKEYGKLGEDYYYRTDTLVAAAKKHGLTASLLDDWEQLGHSQSKIRVTR